MSEKAQTNIRIDRDVLDGIDKRAKEVGLSRNEWIERCSRWALHNLPYRADAETRTRVALAAPAEVKGKTRMDMGLDGIEGK